MENYILEKAKEWAQLEVFDKQTREEVTKLIEEKNDKDLTDRFYRDLEFGTGGLRGILGAGTARMNIYNVRKATLSLIRYLEKQYQGKDLRIAISHDSRRYSREFAETVAAVAAAYNVKSFITEGLRPVPMLSFLTRYKECHGGVCVTASHNPPDYNGYKAYWTTGGQVVPPHDKGIIEEFNAIQDYGVIKEADYNDALDRGMVEIVGKDFDEIYFKKVLELSASDAGKDDVKIVYTPLHGAGLYPVTECLKRFGFQDVTVVPEQEKPNGDFPTVKSPNPEDLSALKLALELGEKTGADLVMGTDPDCDRVGIVIRHNDKLEFLNGNQLGCVLTYYYLTALDEAGRLPKDALVVKTIVTTELQNKLAEAFGAHVDETLTGFKWIADLIEDYETGKKKPYRQFVCGGEESYGFMAGDFVRDKDGVVACCIAAEMVAYYKAKGMSMLDVLDEIYRKHGVYHESLLNVVLPGKEGADKISAMMEGFRKNTPREIDGISVEKVFDIQSGACLVLNGDGFESQQGLDLPKSNVLQFYLEDGSKISVRPSGTEPKIKFYVSVHENVGRDVSREELEQTKQSCREKVARLEKAFSALAES